MAGQGADADGKPPEHHLLRFLVATASCCVISNASNTEQLLFVPSETFASSEVTLSLSQLQSSELNANKEIICTDTNLLRNYFGIFSMYFRKKLTCHNKDNTEREGRYVEGGSRKSSKSVRIRIPSEN